MGYATPQHTPEARGFDEYLGYLTGAEDYYMHTKGPVPQCASTRDLWRGTSTSSAGVVLSQPAAEPRYFPMYSAFIFTEFLVEQIAKHAAAAAASATAIAAAGAAAAESVAMADAAAIAGSANGTHERHGHHGHPLFIYAAYQSVHGPLEVPRRFFDLYERQGAGSGECTWSSVSLKSGFKCDPPAGAAATGYSSDGKNCYCNRLLVKAQVAALDEAVGNVTLALTAAGYWENTVLFFMGDNGGPTFEGHSNYPLRGGKLNFFEGGVRPACFVSSPLLPAAVQGPWFRFTCGDSS
jgi:hypothetical protein